LALSSGGHLLDTSPPLGAASDSSSSAIFTQAAQQVLGAQSGLSPAFAFHVPPDGPIGFFIFLVA
jgi:hypothetical protein